MLRRRRPGRRARLALAGAFAFALFGTGAALAATETIVGGPGDSYSKAIYTTDQGAVVPFQNLGGTHNVTARQNGSNGQPLFKSPDTSGGTTGVEGTQYLGPGDYPFYCTFHPSTMNATLRVTGAGAAQSRPQATLAVKTKKIAKALKKGLQVVINANTRIDGAELVAKLGKATIGRASGLSWTAGQQVDVVKLNKAGKSKLRAKDKATVKVTADIPFGTPASAKAKLK